VIARSIIEGAASAAWILDPAINIRDRVIRAALLEHESILEARKVESAGGGDGSGYNKQILEPVSYTHLDVYKRQGSGLAEVVMAEL